MSSNKKFDYVSVGLTILDVLGRPIDSIPQGGGVQFIDEIRLTVAGTAAGTVIDAAKLGLKTALVAAVGDDEKGDFVIASLKKFSVDTSFIKRIAGIPTSATILTIRPNGERPASHQRGASDHLLIEESEFESICNAKYLHMGGTGLLKKMDGEPTRALLKSAKEKGCITTFDVLAIGKESWPSVESCLPFIDYFMPSMEEAVELSGRKDPHDICKFFLEHGAKNCILKWGSHGSFAANKDEFFQVPAFKVNVVDTTGCGDAFCAGFVAGLNKGWDIKQSIKFGTAAAGLVATGLGSDAGIIDFENTFQVMENLPVLEV